MAWRKAKAQRAKGAPRRPVYRKGIATYNTAATDMLGSNLVNVVEEFENRNGLRPLALLC